MTGYGSAQTDCPAGRLSLELKSVNSRFFELFCRMPDEFRWAESALRDKIQAQVQRGKVELRLHLTRTDASLSKTLINSAGLASALRLAHEIRGQAPDVLPFTVNDLLKLPGVVVESQLDQDEWLVLLTTLLDQALAQFNDARRQEGQRLCHAIEDRIGRLTALAGDAAARVPEAIRAQEKRISEKLREAISGLRDAAPATDAPQAAPIALEAHQLTALDERIRQEAALFGLRVDIAEELDRLRIHLSAMQAALTPNAGKDRDAGIGKRLDFLSQEMNREANTLGSKSGTPELSNISIDMKLLIEQIREQAQNLE